MNQAELRQKANWVRKETLLIHKNAQETRIASSLSCVEILVTLFYGGIINYDPKDVNFAGRDQLIISKAHGAISFYPILADLGYIAKEELARVCQAGSLLGGIPDMLIPGFETINGSLGHGVGVACGKAIAKKRSGRPEKIFTLVGDGELYEGSVWEAIMLAGEQKLDNLTVIVDANKACMLDFCRNILDLEPLGGKFAAFKWQVVTVDGHDLEQLSVALKKIKANSSGQPTVLIANTVKGKGAPSLETDPLSHIKNLNGAAIDSLVKELS